MGGGPAGALSSAGSLEIHLQVKGAGDRLMVTDAVLHVADIAPQRQAEVGGRQPLGVGVGPGLPLRPPQDAVGPCRLAFFLTGGGGEEECGEKGWHESKKVPPTSLLEPRTPGPLSGHETPGPQWECGMAAGRRGPERIRSILAFVRLSQGPSV